MKPRFSLLITLCLLAAGCDFYDTRLTIVNNTSSTIFFELPKGGHFKKYPIVIDRIKRDTLWHYMHFVPPKDSTKILLVGRNEWEKQVNEAYKDSILTVFIFSQEILKSTPADSLILKQLYTKKFSYKVKDLMKINWRIEYNK